MCSQVIKAKKHVESTERIFDGGSDRRDFIRLDRNERTTPFTADVIEELRERITSYVISAYPEPNHLYEQLARFLDIESDQLLLTSGSDLAIKTVFEVFVDVGDQVVIHAPSYAMSSVYCSLFGASKIEIPFDRKLNLDIDEFCDAISADSRLAIFENPNGFVGKSFSKAELTKVLQKSADTGTILLVDEAYFHFCDTTMIDEIVEYQNLIISRTFSKAFGVAGVRLGYLAANAKLINQLSKFRPMHEITSVSHVIGSVLLNHPDVLADRVRENKKVMAATVDTLKHLGIVAHATDADFILLEMGNRIKNGEFQEEMRQAGILVRRPFAQPFLSGLVRVSVGSKEQMDHFVNTLENVISAE